MTKHSIMKYTLGLPQWPGRVICVSAAMLFFVLSAHAQTDAVLKPIGGIGGRQFVARCPQGQLLTGFELRTGDDVDAIKIICVTAYGPADVGPLVTGGERFGGNGGGPRQLLCPRDAPIVTGVDVNWAGQQTPIVNGIHLFCGVAATTQTPSQFPAAVFDGSRVEVNEPGIDFTDSYTGGRGFSNQYCPAGLVAVGISGRSGIWLDAVGLICGPPTLTPKPAPPPDRPVVKLVDRVKLPPADLNALAARGAAIANEDPLTARLRNLQPEGPVRRGFDIGIAAAEGQTEMGPGKQKIHDYLSPAEREGFTTAVSFSLARNKQRIDDLETKGAVIANRDPLALMLRNQQPAGAARRGFDIGMAAAEGQTAPGPGKQRIHDSLGAVEQGGFDVAVAFSLERNRNSDLAAKGAAIAKVDPIVAAARTAEPDVFYRLGFDIATGIFGDKALGAKGDTAITPSSQKIRDSLSTPGQRGFDSSMKLHLSRKYKR